jgi:hypothetical protein
MDRRGQLTLETAVLLMVAINILLYMTLPVGRVSQRAIESIGVNALAVKAIDSIVQEANLVGASGEGARGVIEVNLRKEFSSLLCPGTKTASVTFSYYNVTWATPKSDFGIQDLITPGSHSYGNSADYGITCNFTGITLGNNTEVCMCFEDDENSDNIKVTAVNKTFGECVCPSNVCECHNCGDCTAALKSGSCPVIRLATDIAESTATCIFLVNQPGMDVVLDCNDKSILGGGSHVGIDLSNDVDGLTILNCKFSGWETGIKVGDQCDNTTIIGATISDCDTGILLQPNSRTTTVNRNTVCVSPISPNSDIEDKANPSTNYGDNTCNVLTKADPLSLLTCYASC